jgi:hypothetical protein
MSSADQIQIVLVQEFGDHFRSEGKGHATVVLAPAGDVFVGVGPEQVAQQTLVGHVRRPHDPPNLFHGLQVGTESCNAIS